MTLTVLRNTCQVFGRMSHYWDFSDVFIIIRQRLWFSGRKTTGIKCHFHHITSRVHTINMTSHGNVDLQHVKAEAEFARVFYCEVTCFLSLFILCFWKKFTIMKKEKHSLPLRGGELYSSRLYT